MKTDFNKKMNRRGLELSVFNTIIQKTAVQDMEHTHTHTHSFSHTHTQRAKVHMMIIAHIALTNSSQRI